jgi:hypothetical protein
MTCALIKSKPTESTAAGHSPLYCTSRGSCRPALSALGVSQGYMSGRQLPRSPFSPCMIRRVGCICVGISRPPKAQSPSYGAREIVAESGASESISSKGSFPHTALNQLLHHASAANCLVKLSLPCCSPDRETFALGFTACVVLARSADNNVKGCRGGVGYICLCRLLPTCFY